MVSENSRGDDLGGWTVELIQIYHVQIQDIPEFNLRLHDTFRHKIDH